jgi:hypothetical protein
MTLSGPFTNAFGHKSSRFSQQTGARPVVALNGANDRPTELLNPLHAGDRHARACHGHPRR